MKLSLLLCTLFLSFNLFAENGGNGPGNASSTFAGEPKATLCREEATQYAKTIASDANATVVEIKTELVMFDYIDDVPVEGWSFYTSAGKTLIVIASADGSGADECRLSSIYYK